MKNVGFIVYRITPERNKSAIPESDFTILSLAFVTASWSPPEAEIWIPLPIIITTAIKPTTPAAQRYIVEM